jgi:hypothetical protein
LPVLLWVAYRRRDAEKEEGEKAVKSRRWDVILPTGAGKYYKRGMLVEMCADGLNKCFVVKKIKGDQAVVAEPILPDWARNALHTLIRWFDWPNRYIFDRIDGWIWYCKNIVMIEGYRAVMDEVMKRRKRRFRD